jgi:hypothetical protein
LASNNNWRLVEEKTALEGKTKGLHLKEQTPKIIPREAIPNRRNKHKVHQIKSSSAFLVFLTFLDLAFTA